MMMRKMLTATVCQSARTKARADHPRSTFAGKVNVSCTSTAKIDGKLEPVTQTSVCIHACRSGTRPVWMSSSAERSRIATGPGSPSLTVHEPNARDFT